ncbi:MAG: dTDP-4-dehydrorhamnose reductase [Candidatus Cyclobacteriaceae bacterium M2_1C_046]
MKKILVTGSKGQLGSEIFDRKQLLNDAEFIFTDIEELDITSKEAVNNFFDHHQPNYLINCAAYTAVDKAESEPELAYKINRDAVEHLALACKDHKTRMIHVSTDYVFDGTNYKPYTEEDKPNPASVYGQSKYEGELAVQAHLNNAYTFRTSWVYSSHGNNFVKTIIRLSKEREELNIVADQVGTPTFAGDLAEVILGVIKEIEEGKVASPGLYHFSNEGVASWYDFALAIKAKYALSAKINPISSSEYPTPAKRPMYSLLSKQKIKENFHLSIKYWRYSLPELVQNK